MSYAVVIFLSVIFTLMLTSLTYELMHAADRLNMDVEHDATKQKLKQSNKDVSFLLGIITDNTKAKLLSMSDSREVVDIMDRVQVEIPTSDELFPADDPLFNVFVYDYDWGNAQVNDELAKIKIYEPGVANGGPA